MVGREGALGGIFSQGRMPAAPIASALVPGWRGAAVFFHVRLR